jgi:hypothetical protein
MGLLSKLLQRRKQQRNNWVIAAVLLVSAMIAACTNDPAPPDDTEPAIKGSASYTIYAHNLRPVRQGEFVHLWARYKGDTSWHWMLRMVLPRNYGDDSSRLSGRYKFTRSLDSIEKLMVSIETIDSPSTPTTKLIAGAFLSDAAQLRPEDADGVGDYSTITASVIFTSNAEDSMRYLQEFYFARRENGVLVPSINELPPPPQGWKYAIWMNDSNFFPEHKFFYGYLESPELPDSRNTKDSYPLPGGYEGPLLNREGGKLMVTLEPSTMQPTLRKAGPSPYTIMYAPLPKKLVRDQSLQMINTDNSGLPVVKITFRKD